ncbi:MAG: flagellin lysine-N-methylase [Lachnospiraceae bacterium]|nr:flagellin lysine-N-methylase [Lachnospiraceae bacterium]
MRYVKPHYYDEFKCIADKCPDTCCAGWQIVIDDDTLEKYAASKGKFSARLKNSIDWREGCFLQNNKRCAMLNDNNLCDLVLTKGEEWLCNTCDKYPRHVEEFDGVREWSLSLSCPVAAELMLRSEEQVKLIIDEDEEPDPLEDEFEDFDFMLFTQLEDAREVLFEIVKNRGLGIKERLAVIMEFASKLQACLDEDRLFDMEDVIRGFADGSVSAVPKLLKGEEKYAAVKEGFKVFHKLERLRDDWEEVVGRTEGCLYGKGCEDYELIENEFAGGFVNLFGKDKWEIFLEQILVFFIYTYFCGAVYDDCIYSKVALSVFSVWYIKEFIMCTWYLNGKSIDMEECIRLAYRYAREVEHSDDNLNTLEEWFDR